MSKVETTVFLAHYKLLDARLSRPRFANLHMPRLRRRAARSGNGACSGCGGAYASPPVSARNRRGRR